MTRPHMMASVFLGGAFRHAGRQVWYAVDGEVRPADLSRAQTTGRGKITTL